ncbi:aspartyl-phosphate phosphatase Spo0E family protein [Paenibacillus sp. FSL L8-0463]|uniref:aspartyl-phosphate phosphatase Spo0E family protein n=1 Tax=Paenibacillus sp. FSL L8-0463 TaxID=2954687 RepID=UPI003119F686
MNNEWIGHLEDQLSAINQEIEKLRDEMNKAASTIGDLSTQMRLAEGTVLELSEKLDQKIIEFMMLKKELNIIKNRSQGK